MRTAAALISAAVALACAGCAVGPDYRTPQTVTPDEWHSLHNAASAPAGDPTSIGQNYAEAYWNVSFGFVWYLGCKASNQTVSGYAGLPLLPVADNGSFLIKAPTGDL